MPANVMLRQLNPHLAEEVVEVQQGSCFLMAKCWREIILNLGAFDRKCHDHVAIIHYNWRCF
jgi:hypothetical protein